MNPNTKLLLEEMRKEFADQKLEMKKAFAEQDAKWESRLSAVESKQDERVDALEHAAKEFESWKPTIESSVQVVKTEVQKLSRHWSEL
jgi:HAMP domain-containing protein